MFKGGVCLLEVSVPTIPHPCQRSKKTLEGYIIIWLNWSSVKRSILINTGLLSGPNFAIQTAKMDRSQSDFTHLCS